MSQLPLFRIGCGTDVHQLKAGRPCVIGGVNIPSEIGFEGHSDADVLLHAIMDALLGAAGKEDIGHFFPNTDPKFKGANSMKLLAEVWKILSQEGWGIENIDCSLLLEEPKVGPHREQMQKNISETLDIAPEQVGIKASTAEKLGALGRGEGGFAIAVALLRKERA